MTAPLPALSAPARAESLEALREAWRVDLGRQREGKRDLARRTWPLFLHWATVHRNGNRRQFMQWLSGEADPPTNLYNYLSGGLALHSELDFGLGVSDLAKLGELLSAGRTVDDLRDLLEAGGMSAVRAALTQRRQEGHLTVPTSELPAVRDAVQRVSENESVSPPQALALIVQAHERMSPEMQRAVLTAARTGQRIEDGAREVVARMLDPRQWLAARPCSVPGCGMTSGTELHHLKLDGTRFRTQDVYLPVCAYHHRAEPGHSSEAAHAAHQTAWIERHWGSQEAFWQSLAALYAERLFGED